MITILKNLYDKKYRSHIWMFIVLPLIYVIDILFYLGISLLIPDAGAAAIASVLGIIQTFWIIFEINY